MLTTAPVQEALCNPLPKRYHQWNLKEKLYYKRSSIPAVTHIDFSARVQTVNATTNKRFYELLTAFKSLTGIPILINTSFNMHEEPIVCTPFDAIRAFLQGNLDYLAIGPFLVKQPDA